ncbi:MAG: NAD(P)/FAD-dependent oxidoreductase [Firmicutes bacterium]|nr:NAD(P)/FAD-dependent oxidoreductase [[Eubacterium] siraeum]MCM1488148.1 NAD(P)/FAD-dependent oxidoreductase [Bacillota bacterium]
MYDVIVIGAGPSGCTAAKVLADMGFRVILLEKCRLPRYKSCSGVLIKKTLELVKQYYGEKVPAITACSPAKNMGMVFTDDNGKEYSFPQEGLNVWRSSFDFWLAQNAEESGARLKDGCFAAKITQSLDAVSVTLGDGEEITGKYAVVCEGAAGTLKRSLTGRNTEYITTFQTFNKGSIDLDHHWFYAYLQPELSQYDAWFNVKDGHLVLGVSVADTDKISDYYHSFLSYMETNHKLKIVETVKEEKWLMPLIKPDYELNCGIGRIFFAGEQAGFLNPMGEGISSAVESGAFAAEGIAEGFDAPKKALEIYTEKIQPLLTYMKRQWRFTGSIAGSFGKFLSE